jgi:hypothetical protein
MPNRDGSAARRRRAKYAVYGAVAAALVAMLVVWLRPAPTPPVAGPVTDAANSAHRASDAQTPGAGDSAHDPAGTVELCGHGRVAPIRSIDDYPPGVVAAANQAMALIASDLQALPQPSRQALGHYAQLVAAMRVAGEDFERREPKCDDAACAQRRRGAAASAAAPFAQSLARLAVASQDGTAYAFALYGCRLNREGACAQLSAARWAQLAPDNAVPWFVLADEAQAQKEDTALIAALHRASRAKTSEYEWAAILALAEHPRATALDPAARLVFLSTLIGIYSAFPTPAYLAVGQACAADRIGEPQRRQLCSDLATMMTERSGSLLEFSLGTSIGERVGWPPARVQRLRDEKDAIFMVSTQDWSAYDVHSCRFLEQIEARTREFATLGELRAGRQRVSASGRPENALAGEWRELQRRQREAATRQDAPGLPPASDRPAGDSGTDGR